MLSGLKKLVVPWFEAGWACLEWHVELSAMMVVLKLCRVRQDTLSSVLEEDGKAMVAQRKFRLRAQKYRRRVVARGQQWGQAAHERDELEE
jgi:hypothetical protein